MRTYSTNVKFEIHCNNSSEAIKYTKHLCDFLKDHSDVNAEYVSVECHCKGE